MKNELNIYDKYKETGLFWLEKIPSHWSWLYLSQVCHEQKIKNTDGLEDNVLSLSYGKIIRKKNKDFGLVPKEYNTYQIVNNGNIILRLTDLQNDKKSLRTGLVKETGIITSAYACLKTNNNPAYLHYLLNYYDLIKVFYGLGGGVRQSIGFNDIRKLQLPVPPQEEQIQIVHYLDNKLAKINKLIKAKKKQIELLKEQKQAVINEAVTKGLDPNAKMKPSGVEWLGNIPEDWVIKPLKYLVRSNIETLTDTCDNNLEIDYIDISTVGFNHLKQKPVKYLFKNAPSRARRVIHTGDTIISTVRTYLKSMWYVSEQFDGFIASTGFAVLTPNEEVFPKLLNYILSADNFINRVNKYSIGVSYPAISETKLTNFKIALPTSIEEQSNILEYIIAKTKIVDKTISKIDSEINLITEYRTSLISEVVTGKIDVRGTAVEEVIAPELDEEFDLDEEVEMEDFPESEE